MLQRGMHTIKKEGRTDGDLRTLLYLLFPSKNHDVGWAKAGKAVPSIMLPERWAHCVLPNLPLHFAHLLPVCYSHPKVAGGLWEMS